MAKRMYTVDLERDESGWWVASVRGLQGVHTQGRTVAQARERIREALRAAGANGDAELKMNLPRDLKATLEAAREVREEAERLQSKAQRVLRDAARDLSRRGISVRDAGDLLDLSHQRVHQLLASEASVPKKARRG